MATDCVLDDGDGNWLTVKGAVLNAQAADFMLDYTLRRSPALIGIGYRRALVHNQNDGLTVNFANDYPGGLTLNAVAAITPKPVSADFSPVEDPRIPELVVEGGIQFLWNNGPLHVPASEAVSLQSVIAALQLQVVQLQERVAALEQG